ncbi:peptidoglycan DD-metalloendopeptidase family protein [Legionella spiritensis]|uniref:LysM domain-containing protein n=1 Tax=Legionella spiritensis TaxID=452 RepID=A0A0W0Z8L1_LEGSP|nr:peptidoglycan DD-metalloendopeptidase family protein [Legionella spiritensis]KTD65461.1 hypothetical protein Lspi_0535 [Legionella spiritensis]SNV35768.1 lipoprotein NlpD [Legionella spiritensis]
MSRYYLLLLLVFLAGCEQRTDLAPVVELKWRPQTRHVNTHVVKRGETLYAVAFRYDKDYRALAVCNHLNSPYALRVGQVISLKDSNCVPSRTRASHPRTGIAAKSEKRPIRRSVSRSVTRYAPGAWQWPAKGRIANRFIPRQGKKGIDIAGKKGEIVRASRGGIVAYAGNGLPGYGNLIIIKHDGRFLTAYGNNLRNRVREGQRVKTGQIIADMGVVDRKFWGVHFEIRQSGQPVNPMNYLQKG